MNKPKVVKYLVKIVKRYDVILIQEIRDKSGTAINKLLKKVNENNYDPYKLIISERIGRSSMKETICFFISSFEIEGHISIPIPRQRAGG